MIPDIPLDPFEARVLGVLIEKNLTTPDLYPLTLHAVTLGTNQKSNRDPFMELLEGDVYAALQKLIRRGLAGSVHPVGARVEKFRHNTEAVLKIGTPQAAVLAELLMRGPQQPGELRTRANRMTPLDSQPALMETLKPLLENGIVVRIDPGAGSRVERFAQTLSTTAHPIDVPRQPVRPSTVNLPPVVAPAAISSSAPESRAPLASSPHVGGSTTPSTLPEEALMDAQRGSVEQRVAELEASVAKLRRQLDNLAWKLGEQLKG